MQIKQSKKELYRDNAAMQLFIDRCRASNAELVIVNEMLNKQIYELKEEIKNESKNI